MTAWNRLIGALIVKGYSEQQALELMYDVLAEEAERLRSNKVPHPVLDEDVRWNKAIDQITSELDPDDPNWTARCRTCHLPWSKDHVCYVAWYDEVIKRKTHLVDDFAQTLAVTDASRWGHRVVNEDDPTWVVYKTYGEATWQALLDAIRAWGAREIKKNEHKEVE